MIFRINMGDGNMPSPAFISGCRLIAVFFALSLFSGCGSEVAELSITPHNQFKALITGSVSYQDRTFGPQGFTGKVKTPVRRAVVQLRATGSNALVAESGTDENGTYSFNAFIQPQKSYYVSCLAKSGAVSFSVTDTTGNIYVYKGNDFTADLNITSELYITDSDAEPFNIFDSIHDGFNYLATLTSLTGLKHLTVEWEPNKSTASYYDKPKNVIYLAAAIGADDDGWDDTVILHEFSHYVAKTFSKDDSLQLFHNYQAAIDKRQAWSEGWATFFALKVMAWRGQKNPQYYLDTTGEDILGPSTILVSFEIESPSFPQTSYGDNNEISVASILWKLAEHISPFDSHLGAGSSLLWDVVHSYMPGKKNVSFETFWDGWNSMGYQVSYNLLPILQERDVEYWSDSYEPNDVPAAAVPYTAATANGMHFTFYPEGDVEYISFSGLAGTAYKIVTQNVNGADTLLELYSKTGVLLAANDNTDGCVTCTNPKYLASSIIFTPTISDNYFIKIFSSPAGISKYGSFDLLIE